MPAKQDAEQTNTVKYYMHHHAVISEDKATTKLRIVFDASAHEEGCLFTGPNLNLNLLDMLMKFRLHNIAVRYHQGFSVDSHNRKRQICCESLMTLPTQGTKNMLCIMRINREVFGGAPSPFLLAATIRNHSRQYETKQPEALRESPYVDDFISSSSDVEKTYSITTQAKANLSDTGMNLCKWTTKSAELEAKWTKGNSESTAESEIHNTVLKVC